MQGAKGWLLMLLSRTLWHIETHLDQPLTLNGVAGDMGVSPEYLTRSFTAVLHRPLMAHVRLRRLSRAAETLASGHGTVIEAALDAGYGSPEAFARAFRAAFGLSPSEVMRRRSLTGLTLIPARMEAHDMTRLELSDPKIEAMPARRILGPMERYDMETRARIPAQWEALDPVSYEQFDAASDLWFGVCRAVGENGEFDYLTGREVPKGTAPNGWAEITLPAGRWARFAHGGHISEIGSLFETVFGHWMGRPGLIPAGGPVTEVYPPAFNAVTGEGGYELWVPLV